MLCQIGLLQEFWTHFRQIYDEEFANDIKSFIKKNPLPSSEKLAAQKLERLEANIEFMDNLKEVNNET